MTSAVLRPRLNTPWPSSTVIPLREMGRPGVTGARWTGGRLFNPPTLTRLLLAHGSIYHVPVMLGEVLHYLRPSRGGVYLDGTLGGGGHAEAILSSDRAVRLIGI